MPISNNHKNDMDHQLKDNIYTYINQSSYGN